MDAKERVGQEELSMSADLSSERVNLDEDVIVSSPSLILDPTSDH